MILEGESLVNDATGFIAYRYAVAAVITGQFGFWQAGGQLVWVAGAGIAIGLALGGVLYWVHRSAAHNTVVDISLTLLAPYLLAEEAHVSSVLVVVATGLFLSRHAARIFAPTGRRQVYAVWSTVTFLLNRMVFILIGLQPPVLLAGLSMASCWALAAALALPLTLPSGAAFPQRNLILLLTFAVIVVTLVGQDLSLRPLIRWLGIRADDSAAHDELALRVPLATRTLAYLGSPAVAHQAPAEMLARMTTRYALRLDRRAAGILASQLADKPLTQFEELQEAVIHFERVVIEQLRRAEQTSEEALRKLKNELALEEARLALDRL